jgi:HPt (histidine-containing phosphotransfer) domain-containing protein
MTFPNAVDPATLDQMLEETGGDAEFVVEIIDDYLANARTLLASLAASLMAGDAGATRISAHTLKGTSASLGAFPLSALAAEIEAVSKEGTTVDAAAVLPKLEESFATVEQALAREQARFRSDA